MHRCSLPYVANNTVASNNRRDGVDALLILQVPKSYCIPESSLWRTTTLQSFQHHLKKTFLFQRSFSDILL